MPKLGPPPWNPPPFELLSEDERPDVVVPRREIPPLAAAQPPLAGLSEEQRQIMRDYGAWFSSSGRTQVDLAPGTEHWNPKRPGIKALRRDRIEAAIAYITDLGKPSVRRIAQKLNIPEQAVCTWSSEDGWVAKRQEYLDFVYQKLRERMAEALTEDRLKALEFARIARDQTFEMLTENRPEAKSYEALLKGFVEVLRFIDGLGMTALGKIAPGDGSDNTNGNRAGMSENELAAIERAILDVRVSKDDEGTSEDADGLGGDRPADED